jgi:hypothetical protein
MKKIFLFVMVVAGLAACKSPAKGKNGEVYKTPVQYNDYIIGRQTILLKNIMDFAKVAQTDLDSADLMLNDYVRQTNKMIEELRGMPPFRGDSALRDAAISSFSFYRKTFDEYYRDIIKLRKEESEDNETAINDIIEKLTVDEEKYDKVFHNAQRDFAKKNKMKLMDNEMQKEIDQMNDK